MLKAFKLFYIICPIPESFHIFPTGFCGRMPRRPNLLPSFFNPVDPRKAIKRGRLRQDMNPLIICKLGDPRMIHPIPEENLGSTRNPAAARENNLACKNYWRYYYLRGNSWDLAFNTPSGEAMKKNALALILFLIIPWFFNAESPAQVYKYVDKNGVAHYSNVPADPKYKPASKNINRNVRKRYKFSKSRRYSESMPPKKVKQGNQPSLK